MHEINGTYVKIIRFIHTSDLQIKSSVEADEPFIGA